MNPRRSGIRSGLPLLAIAVLFAAGCKTPTSQILLERENFQQEKTIEDLKDQVDDAEHDLAQCRRENAALKKRFGVTSALPGSGSPLILTPPDVTVPSSNPSAPSLFQPPKIDRGTEAPSEDSPAPPSHAPATPDKQSSDQWVPPKEPSPEKTDLAPPDTGATRSSYEEETSPSAVRIAIIRLLTNGHQFGGHNADGTTDVAAFGDNGLQVAFSPRNAENHAVAVEGSVAMVVVDPAISGPETRVARWDFSPEEAKAHYRSTLFGKAYRFDLLWPHGPPRHERLKLFVRLTTPDGQRIEAEQTIHVRVGEQAPAEFVRAKADDSDDGDTPAPHDGVAHPQVVSNETNSRRPSEPRPTPSSEQIGQADGDEPAPPDAGTARPQLAARESAADIGQFVWRPNR
jgi:uncharacterized coiled-coil protein SlyX